MKFKDLGILWLEESSVYVADKSLYTNPGDFLRAVVSHIKELVDKHSDEEAGWFVVPDFDKYLPFVTTSYMVHRLSGDYSWENIEIPGRGHIPVWYMDFALTKYLL